MDNLLNAIAKVTGVDVKKLARKVAWVVKRALGLVVKALADLAKALGIDKLMEGLLKGVAEVITGVV